MYNIISLFLFFLMIVFGILLYFKSKKERQYCLDSGSCPSCGATFRTFEDKTTNKTFKVDVIKTRVLKNHGCSGITEIEYRCEACGLQEVHNSVGQGCKI